MMLDIHPDTDVDVVDFITGEVYTFPVRDCETIDDYGVFCIVETTEDIDVCDDIAVLFTLDGLQFTLDDWQGEQPQSAAEVSDYPRWVEASGRKAVMFDGLPSILA